MKLTTLLTSVSILALSALVAGIVLLDSSAIAGTLFVALLLGLIVVRDYAPRSRFVVTVPSPSRPAVRKLRPAIHRAARREVVLVN